MAEVGRQQRQAALGILIVAIPVHKRIRCKAVSQVMQTGAVTVGRVAQPDLPGQCLEGTMDLSVVQAIAPQLETNK